MDYELQLGDEKKGGRKEEKEGEREAKHLKLFPHRLILPFLMNKNNHRASRRATRKTVQGEGRGVIPPPPQA